MRPIHHSSIVVIAVLLGSLFWVNNDPEAPFIVLIFTFGAMGAVIRELVAIRSKQISDKSSLGSTASAWFSPIIGALLSLVLAALFLSGLVSGDLFPKFVNTEQEFESAKSVFQSGMNLKSNSDFYKMIAWSIIAGYSERFVLSKLEGFTKGTKPKPEVDKNND